MVISRFFTLSALFLLLSGGCTTQRDPLVAPVALPQQYAQTLGSDDLTEGWLSALAEPSVVTLARQAVAQNYALGQQAQLVRLAEEAVVLSGANRLPSASISAGGQRSRAFLDGLIAESYDVSAQVNFDIDLWGSLAQEQRSARLSYAAEVLRFQRAERLLVGNTLITAYNLITAQRLQTLFQQRLVNLTRSLDVIERGYRGGLNEALDVYLAQTNLEQERASVATQEQARFEAATALQRLVSAYPDAQLDLGIELPSLPPLPGHGLPSDLLQRRADVQQAWLELLAADADLAVAQRNRFPSVTLQLSGRDTDASLGQLLDGGKLAFTAAASLVQPLFQGGRLRSLERQAEARVIQSEQRYLEVLYDALSDVENELKRSETLSARLAANRQAERNARSALELAEDQYGRGIVTYTTVLESQRRAFDAQTSVVQLENQLVQNRIALHLALGGGFEA